MEDLKNMNLSSVQWGQFGEMIGNGGFSMRRAQNRVTEARMLSGIVKSELNNPSFMKALSQPRLNGRVSTESATAAISILSEMSEMLYAVKLAPDAFKEPNEQKALNGLVSIVERAVTARKIDDNPDVYNALLQLRSHHLEVQNYIDGVSSPEQIGMNVKGIKRTAEFVKRTTIDVSKREDLKLKQGSIELNLLQLMDSFREDFMDIKGKHIADPALQEALSMYAGLIDRVVGPASQPNDIVKSRPYLLGMQKSISFDYNGLLKDIGKEIGNGHIIESKDQKAVEAARTEEMQSPHNAAIGRYYAAKAIVYTLPSSEGQALIADLYKDFSNLTADVDPLDSLTSMKVAFSKLLTVK